MSKVQDAINVTRKQAQSASVTLRKGSRIKSAIRSPSVLMHLEDGPTCALDARQMERSCILPFIKHNGAINAYKLLRTRLLQRMRDNQWRSLMVTGTTPSDGKTTTAINLAVGASQDVNQAVVLVDMDLERPAVARSLGLKRGNGLSDYLLGKVEVEHVIYNTDVDRLFIVPNFEASQSSESSISPRMLSLLEHVKQLDPNILIILDMPPVLSSDSALAFGPHVDALLLVVSEGRTNRGFLKRTNQMIEDIPLAGIVLNRSTEGDSGSYY